MFEWMAWTLPVAVFFSCIVLMLVGMTVWEIKSPTILRKGFLPIATTRGDRLFIGLLARRLRQPGLRRRQRARWSTGSALEQEPSIWISFVAVDGAAGADHAQGLRRESRNGAGRSFPSRHSQIKTGEAQLEETDDEIALECRGLGGRRPGPGPERLGRRGRGQEVDRQRVPAVDAEQGPADRPR